MRFILNFIFFGILFYAIYYFFPDAFEKLVTWAGDVFNYIKEFVQQIVNKVNSSPDKKEGASHVLWNFFN